MKTNSETGYFNGMHSNEYVSKRKARRMSKRRLKNKEVALVINLRYPTELKLATRIIVSNCKERIYHNDSQRSDTPQL